MTFQDPLFLDVIGTCHSETVKPAVLQAKHVQRYRLHVDRGLSFTPPEVSIGAIALILKMIPQGWEKFKVVFALLWNCPSEEDPQRSPGNLV